MSNRIKRISGWILIIGTVIFSFLKADGQGTDSVFHNIGYLIPPALIGLLFSRIRKGTAAGFLIGAATFSILAVLISVYEG